MRNSQEIIGSIKTVVCPLVAMLLLVFCFSDAIAVQETQDKKQDSTGKQDDKKSDDKKSDDKKSDDKKSDDKKQDEESGEDALNTALELSQKAKSTRDLDKVVDLLDEALGKKLDDESKELALGLLKSTLFSHAEKLSQPIFKVPRDTRWRFYRREALQRLRRLEKVDDKNAKVFLLIARLNGMPDGDTEAGKKAINKAIELAGDDKAINAEVLLVRAALEKDNDEKRLEDLNEAIKLDEKNIRALTMRALYYESKKEFDKAVADMETIIALSPKNLVIYQRLINIYNTQEKWDKAGMVVEKLMAQQPENSMLPTMLAEFLTKAKKNDEALAALEKALEIDDANVTARLMRATVYFEMEKYDEMIEDIEIVLEEQPGLKRAILFRALAYSGLKKYDEAIEDMKLLAEDDPNNKIYKLELARLYGRAERMDEALEIYDGLLEKNSKDVEVLRSRGDTYLTSGKHEKAVKDYDVALKADEKNSGVMNNLAWVLSTSPYDDVRDGKRAVELALKACELTEYKEAHILSTLASSYAEADDFENALKWAKKSVEVGEKEKSSQLVDLKKELEAYKKKKKWRELGEENGAEGEVEFDLDD